MGASSINIVLEESVEKALIEGNAVVALESTIIAHGMPFPQNLKTATLLENAIRQKGAVPATCAVIEGKCKVGLNERDLEILATQDCLKLSRRDLPLAIAQKKNGATTVAGTMILANAAGIQVFATGGIGGVHRNFAKTFDVSADLYELAATEVAVVSAGCKSILDIPNTLELLESLSVPVIGYRTDEFPAFYSRHSREKVPVRMDQPADIARFLSLKWSMGLKGGALIANPVSEEDDLPFEEMENYIKRGLEEASSQRIAGKALTPFLLKYLVECSDGKSLASNVSLALNNASLAAEIAIELAAMR